MAKLLNVMEDKENLRLIRLIPRSGAVILDAYIPTEIGTTKGSLLIPLFSKFV